MKWLTLPIIKSQIRMESSFTDEDELLKLYGAAAESAILRLLNRTWEDVRENLSDDDINGPLTIAGLMLTEHLYVHRGPTENVQTYQIPYAVDFNLKSYMKLASDNYGNNNTQEYGRRCKNL